MYNLSVVEFRSPLDFQKGTIARLLRESYAGLKGIADFDWDRFAKIFDDFDDEVFGDEDVARCTFIMTDEGLPVGLSSFDPRQRPAYGDIGHNCVLPSARGKGYGKIQMRETLRRMQERGIQTARVSTGADSFFEPAQRMYKACGFRETRRFERTEYPPGETIEYELPLTEEIRQ